MSATLHKNDRLIPWYFVLFFLVIAAVDGTMATLAVRSQTGTVTDHPYEKGVAYNKIIAAEQQQESLGWNAAIRWQDGQQPGAGALQVTLTDAHGKPITASKLTAHFSRPTQAALDMDMAIANGKPTPVTLPAPGLWEVRIYAEADGKQYQQAKRIVVP